MGLSGGDEGDLVFYDSPYSAELIRTDYIEESPYSVYDGMPADILQYGEHIKDMYFVVTANANYTPEQNIGDERSYELNEFTYTLYNSAMDETTLKPSL